jgi:N-acetylmuramic acid 6-phosphate etherase
MVRVMEDTRSILAAAFGDGPGIVVIAGTGSNVAGQKSLATPIEKAGGWGHLFADRGSAYDVARRGMEAVFALWDEERRIDILGREFLAAAKLDSLEELVPFLLRDTSKTTVAGYAPCVFTAAQHGDRTACALLDEAAGELARRVSAVAKRLGVRPVRVVLTGGLFENQAEYRARFHKALKKVMPGAQVNLADVPGVLGAARVVRMKEEGGREKVEGERKGKRKKEKVGEGLPLPAGLDVEATAAIGETRSGASQDKERSQVELGKEGKEGGAAASSTVARRSTATTELKPIAEPARLAAFSAASTEQRNPRSRGLDKRTIPQLVDLFIREERYVDRALFAQRGAIARAAALVAKKLQAGGRLIYVGAGTSGRLGVVDASEMPPTFNAPPEQVQAIMAGGAAAVFKSQEGAEDARDTAVTELRARKLAKNDVVCGIAASGQTPFVLAALEEARRIGAGAILVSCNPKRRIKTPVDVAIDLPTGPEIVTGSTRLKAGTVTKLVLNMLSTIAMVRLGRVSDNLMTNVQATNDKLRARCVRLVEALAKVDASRAQEALETNGWRVLEALEVLKKAGGKKRG